MSKIITRLPEDIYGNDKWAIIFNDPPEAMITNPEKHPDYLGTPFVHWSLLSDNERDIVRWEWLMEEPVD